MNKHSPVQPGIFDDNKSIQMLHFGHFNCAFIPDILSLPCSLSKFILLLSIKVFKNLFLNSKQ